MLPGWPQCQGKQGRWQGRQVIAQRVRSLAGLGPSMLTLSLGPGPSTLMPSSGPRRHSTLGVSHGAPGSSESQQRTGPWCSDVPCPASSPGGRGMDEQRGPHCARHAPNAGCGFRSETGIWDTWEGLRTRDIESVLLWGNRGLESRVTFPEAHCTPVLGGEHPVSWEGRWAHRVLPLASRALHRTCARAGEDIPECPLLSWATWLTWALMGLMLTGGWGGGSSVEVSTPPGY